jgi:anti-anti-sigma factor
MTLVGLSPGATTVVGFAGVDAPPGARVATFTQLRESAGVMSLMSSKMPVTWYGEPARLCVWRASTVLHVRGDVDVATAADFRRTLAICDADPIVRALDLAQVTFFSAAGVRCFVEADWPRRPHVGIIASRAVRRVLDVCGLEFLLAPHGWRDAFDGWTSTSSAWLATPL